MRIVSLLPSATEIVCGLGLRDHLVGVTHECDYPAEVRGLPAVTRSRIPAQASSREIDAAVRQQLQDEPALYALDTGRLAQLRPDVIITQTLCGVCAVAESQVQAALASLPDPPRVVNLQPTCLADMFRGITEVGQAVGDPNSADRYLKSLRTRVDAVRQRSDGWLQRPSVVMLEWMDPLFSAGHWNPELVELAGGRELIGRAGQRSTTMTWEELRRADPEVIVIACCGFDIPQTKRELPTLEAQPGWADLQCVRNGRVFVVDGSAYFNRPGPRLVDSLEQLAEMLHPSEVGGND